MTDPYSTSSSSSGPTREANLDSQQSKSALPFEEIWVQPTVLLSCADHHDRIKEQRVAVSKRVIGGLLGKVDEESKSLCITNCFAVPYDEDTKENGSGLFVENDYINTIYAMLLKINRNEKLVGWYHTGSEMFPNDLNITRIFKKHCSSPVILRINLEAHLDKLPFEAFISMNYNSEDGSSLKNDFKGIPCKIVPEESETVGIEQLLRCIKDTHIGDLQSKIDQKAKGALNLRGEFNDMSAYLRSCAEGTIKPNNDTIYNIQKIWHSIPRLNLSQQNQSVLVSTTNDSYLMAYISSMARATYGLHSLIENKISNKDLIKNKV